MAEKKFSELTTITSINDASFLTVLQSSVNTIITWANIKTLLAAVAWTFSGVITFSQNFLTNGISERTADTGVTIDSVLCKDGMVKVSGTPTAAGMIGYGSGLLKLHNGTGVIDIGQQISAVTSRSSNTIWAAADNAALFVCTSTFTQTITAAATLGAKWFVDIRNDGTGVITLDPNGTETIDGLTTLKVYPGESFRIVCDGSNFKTVGRRKGEIILSRQTASNSATLDFTTGLDDTEFDGFIFRVKHIVPATDATGLWCRFSTNAGSSYAAGASDYVYAGDYEDSAGGSRTPVVSTGAAQIVVSAGNTMGNSTGESYSITISLPNPANSSIYKHINVVGGGYNSTPRHVSTQISGTYVGATSAVTGIRFMMSSGNITSGTIELIGIRK